MVHTSDVKSISVGVLLLLGFLPPRAAAQGTCRPPKVYNPGVRRSTARLRLTERFDVSMQIAVRHHLHG